MSLTVVVNIVPAAIVKDDWDVGTLETVIFTVALEDFIEEKYVSMIEKNRWFLNIEKVRDDLGNEGRYSRKTWALINLEIWQQIFHDKEAYYKNLIK